MQRIQEDIKTKHFHQIYLLYGQERYLCRQYRDRLKVALSEEVDPMNIHSFEGKSVPVGEIIDLSETMPFFAPRRIFILENTTLFKSSGEQMAAYLSQLPETSYFIFVEREVDKRTKLYKTVKEKGLIAEMTTPDENTLKKWAASILKKEGLQTTESSLEYLLGKTGTDMENLRTELEKLVCYCADKKVVTQEEIDAICTVRISNRIFDLVSAIAEHQHQKAFSLYYDLIALKEPPMRILFLIARQYQLLLTVKQMKMKGYPQKDIAAAISLPPFVAGKYSSQSNRFTMQELQDTLLACVEAEEAIKTGLCNDRLSLELLILSVLKRSA
ncbi:MAG: DNA polymerase III subunit delta [Lachnospiraceae bacterium]|nr:DNA polymerase III subunit delta [Lachnospiraceae bacterium]